MPFLYAFFLNEVTYSYFGFDKIVIKCYLFILFKYEKNMLIVSKMYI